MKIFNIIEIFNNIENFFNPDRKRVGIEKNFQSQIEKKNSILDRNFFNLGLKIFQSGIENFQSGLEIFNNIWSEQSTYFIVAAGPLHNLLLLNANINW